MMERKIYEVIFPAKYTKRDKVNDLLNSFKPFFKVNKEEKEIRIETPNSYSAKSIQEALSSASIPFTEITVDVFYILGGNI